MVVYIQEALDFILGISIYSLHLQRMGQGYQFFKSFVNYSSIVFLAPETKQMLNNC